MNMPNLVVAALILGFAAGPYEVSLSSVEFSVPDRHLHTRAAADGTPGTGE